jgi:hypothetical protein
MPKLTALLHTSNDALRVGRALETLYPCDEILIVDHGSHDGTIQVAHEYGVRMIAAEAGVLPDRHLESLREHWILCLDSRESVTESLAASLFEWKLEWKERPPESAFSIRVREETATGWIAHPVPQTRLIPGDWKGWREPGWQKMRGATMDWQQMLPAHDSSAPVLEGEILRFAFP